MIFMPLNPAQKSDTSNCKTSLEISNMANCWICDLVFCVLCLVEKNLIKYPFWERKGGIFGYVKYKILVKSSKCYLGQRQRMSALLVYTSIMYICMCHHFRFLFFSCSSSDNDDKIKDVCNCNFYMTIILFM